MTAAAPVRRGPLLPASVLLTAATFLVPAALVALRGYPGEAALSTAAATAFTQADLSHPVAGSTDLAGLTALWRDFHVAKSLVAALLVVTLAALASRVRRRAGLAGAGPRRRLLLTAYAATLVWLLGALTVLLANLQGAVAPLASVASLLPPDGGGGGLAVVTQVLRRTVGSPVITPAHGVAADLLTDFTVYHAAFAVLAALTGLALLGTGGRAATDALRRRRAGTSSASAWRLHAVLCGTAGAVFLLLSAANASTWAHPVPALVASLGGG